MRKTPRTIAKRARRPTPLKNVKIVLSFTQEQIGLIDRAAAKEDDNRANWSRRRLLADARAALGIAAPTARP